MKSIIFMLLATVCGNAASTQIRDTAYTAFNGTLFSGTITIAAPDMTSQDGRTIQRWEKSFTITNGTVAIDLEPNDTAVPSGTSYAVVYKPQSGKAWSERWIVPTSASSLKIHQVRVASVPAPSLMIQPQQIQSGGATPGQALLWNGAGYAPGSVITQTSWGGIAGNLSNQSDLASALAGKALLSHTHPIADVSGLLAALDGMLKKPPNVYLADAYCATEGVYDQTCIQNAVNAVPAGGGTVHLGDRVYTLAATVSITGRTNLVISGVTSQTYQLVSANGLNAPMLNFTDVVNCALVDVGIDGNGANQSSGSAVQVNAVTQFAYNFLMLARVKIANAKDNNVSALGSAGGAATVGVAIFGSELLNSGGSLIHADAASLCVVSSRMFGVSSTFGLIYTKAAYSMFSANTFGAMSGFHTAVVMDTSGDVTYIGNFTFGQVIGGVARQNGASAANVHVMLSGSTYLGKYQDVGACLGTTPTLTASWASANSMVCLGNNRAAVSMPHGQDTAALFTFDVTGIDLTTGTLTFTPVGHIASTSGNYKWKLEWACTAGSTIPLGDASTPYSTWNVQNINSWWGGFNTQVRGLTNISIAQTSLPNPCDFLQIKITHMGTDPGETSTHTLSLVGLRVQYYAKTN